MNNSFQSSEVVDRIYLKENIKKAAGRCAIMLIVLSFVTYSSASIITYILKTRFQMLSIIDEDSILGVSKDAYGFLLGYLPCIIGDIAAILVGINLNKISLRNDLFCKNEGSFKFVMLSSVSCITVGMVSSTIYLIYSAIIKNHGFIIPSPDFSMPSNEMYIFLFFMYTCVIAPIFEEIIFRGIILKSLLKFGNLSAILISSILFSLFHFNLVQFINPILMGIVFSFIVIKTKSIKSSIIAHMFNNSLILLTTILMNFNVQILQYGFSFIYFIGGLFGFLYFIKDYGNDFIETIKQKNDGCGTIKNVWYSFTSTWVVLYVLLYIMLVTFTFFSKNHI